MKHITFRQRLRYWFDNSLSGGALSIIGWLALISLTIVVAAALVVWIFDLLPDDQKEGGFLESAWQAFLHAIDTGTIANDGAWGLRLVMMLVTIGGIFVVATLISAISSDLAAKLESLRNSHSLVVEKNHTLILGWSPRVFLILRELIEANRNVKKPRIVILADRSKVEMETEIRSRIKQTHNTKIICRGGNPLDLHHLNIANPQASKSIIVLSPKESSDPDAEVIKQILAITNSADRREEPYHIVAELVKDANVGVAKMVGKNEVELVVAEDLISLITVQTSLHAGLSIIYKELLDFEGDEIYYSEEPTLVSKTYADALFAYETCSVMGLVQKDGKIRLNPPMETKIAPGDKIIAIAEDDDRVVVSGTPAIDEKAIRIGTKSAAGIEKILILGWNSKGAMIVTELDKYVLPGSKLLVVAENHEISREIGVLGGKLKNLKIDFNVGDTSDRETLDSLALTDFQHVIVLCYEHYERDVADSKTLVTLLHLRDIEEKKGESYSIVSEMLDVQNRALAEIAKADDFIVSDELAGLMLAQISENKSLIHVFDDLFSADGSEIYLKPAGGYVALGEDVNFYTVVESARRRGETAIGYRIDKLADTPDRQFGVVVNPDKTEKVRFSAEDKIVVLAED